MNQANNLAQPVDVLAVMDRAAVTLAMTSTLREKSKPAREMRAARTAVAELAEAAREALPFIPNPTSINVPRNPSKVEVRARLTAALAALGGAK